MSLLQPQGSLKVKRESEERTRDDSERRIWPSVVGFEDEEIGMASQGMQAASRSWKRQTLPCSRQKGCSPDNTFVLDFGIRNCKIINLNC